MGTISTSKSLCSKLIPSPKCSAASTGAGYPADVEFLLGSLLRSRKALGAAPLALISHAPGA
jgi:hypothetical protein